MKLKNICFNLFQFRLRIFWQLYCSKVRERGELQRRRNDTLSSSTAMKKGMVTYIKGLIHAPTVDCTHPYKHTQDLQTRRRRRRRTRRRRRSMLGYEAQASSFCLTTLSFHLLLRGGCCFYAHSVHSLCGRPITTPDCFKRSKMAGLTWWMRKVSAQLPACFTTNYRHLSGYPTVSEQTVRPVQEVMKYL